MTGKIKSAHMMFHSAGSSFPGILQSEIAPQKSMQRSDHVFRIKPLVRNSNPVFNIYSLAYREFE